MSNISSNVNLPEIGFKSKNIYIAQIQWAVYNCISKRLTEIITVFGHTLKKYRLADEACLMLNQSLENSIVCIWKVLKAM